MVETAENTAQSIKPNLTRRNTATTSSFRLRTPSLNTVRLRRIFDIFDRNNDSLITIDELSKALTLLGLEIDMSELDAIVKSHIKPGNAGLRFEDFEALHCSLNDVFFGLDVDVAVKEADALQDENDLREAFKVFDENGDGFISARELQSVLDKLGMAEGNEINRVEMMISSVDRNHDGRVDFSEFKDMMRNVLVRSA